MPPAMNKQQMMALRRRLRKDYERRTGYREGTFHTTTEIYTVALVFRPAVHFRYCLSDAHGKPVGAWLVLDDTAWKRISRVT